MEGPHHCYRPGCAHRIQHMQLRSAIPVEEGWDIENTWLPSLGPTQICVSQSICLGIWDCWATELYEDNHMHLFFSIPSSIKIRKQKILVDSNEVLLCASIPWESSHINRTLISCHKSQKPLWETRSRQFTMSSRASLSVCNWAASAFHIYVLLYLFYWPGTLHGSLTYCDHAVLWRWEIPSSAAKPMARGSTKKSQLMAEYNLTCWQPSQEITNCPAIAWTPSQRISLENRRRMCITPLSLSCKMEQMSHVGGWPCIVWRWDLVHCA